MYIEEIKYENPINGQILTFKTKPNPLSENQMWWFEPLRFMCIGSVRDAKSVAKQIRAECTILV